MTLTKRQRDEDRAELITLYTELGARLERLARSSTRTSQRRAALARQLGLDDE